MVPSSKALYLLVSASKHVYDQFGLNHDIKSKKDWKKVFF